MKLVEKAIQDANEKESSVKFEKLVVDMMVIGLDERIPTTEHISQALNRNGWNLGEVANCMDVLYQDYWWSM